MCEIQDAFRKRILKLLYERDFEGVKAIIRDPKFDDRYKTGSGAIGFEIINYRDPFSFKTLLDERGIDLQSRNAFGETIEECARISGIRPIIRALEAYKGQLQVK